MRLLLIVYACVALLAGCAKQSDLDAADASLAKATADLATANANLATANKTIDELKAQVGTLQEQAAALQSQNSQQAAQLAIKPPLPVTMIARKALLGGGLTLVFNTTIKTPIAVLVTVRNPTLGTQQQAELQLQPNGPTVLGAPRVPIDLGDVVIVTNGNYSPATYVVQ